MLITVFGSGLCKPGDPDYQQALELGRGLALQGCSVLTGGYFGTMEAVSRGAAESGSHVIGVTCEEIQQWRKISANHWVQEEWLCPTLDLRMKRLMEACDAAIALPGGPGTLTEITLMWNRMIIQSLPSKPFILLSAWQRIMDVIHQDLREYFPEDNQQLFRYAGSIEDALDMLKAIFPPTIE
jgi:uncharacterized protein (TIGR00725 family)